MILGDKPLGTVSVEQISTDSHAITDGFTGEWQKPARKGVAAAAIFAAMGSGFCPTPPAKAAPVFSQFAQPIPRGAASYPEQPQPGFLSAPVRVSFAGFAEFAKPAPQRDFVGSGWSFAPTPPRSVPFSGFFDFNSSWRVKPDIFLNVTAGVQFEITPPPQPIPGGGTSRKLVKGKLVNPLGTAKQAKPPKIELKPVPLPPQRPVIPPPPINPAPALIDAKLIPPHGLTLEQQALSALDEADVKAFLRALDQDEQDAADIAEIIAMLDQNDLD